MLRRNPKWWRFPKILHSVGVSGLLEPTLVKLEERHIMTVLTDLYHGSEELKGTSMSYFDCSTSNYVGNERERKDTEDKDQIFVLIVQKRILRIDRTSSVEKLVN